MRAFNMAVCVKPVPDSRYWDRLSLDPKTKLLRREGIPIILNPMDKNALEEALRIKEARGGRVTCISMGPPNTVEMLAYAYSLGADEAALLSDRAFAGADTLATAYALVAGIKKMGQFDLVLLGQASLDGSTEQVGQQVAEFLDMPCVTGVEKIDIVNDTTIRVKSKIEFGYMTVEAKLPVVLAVTKDINLPRIPSVFGALWATEKQVKKFTAADVVADPAKVGLTGSPTYVPEIANIEMQRRGEVLKGNPEDIAKQLVEKLRADGVLPEAK